MTDEPNIWTRLDEHATLTTKGGSYGNRVKGASLKALLFLVAAVLISTVALFGFTIFWHIFIDTSIGQQYETYFPGRAKAIYAFLEANLLITGLQLTIVSFVVTLGTGLACKFLHIIHYMYIGRGFFFRLGFCTIPLTFLVASINQSWLYGIDDGVIFLVSLVPTMMVLSCCFDFADTVLPEMATLLAPFKKYLPESWQQDSEEGYEIQMIEKTMRIFFIAAALNTIIMISGKSFWEDFIKLAAGKQFIKDFGPLAQIITDIVSRDVIFLSFKLTIVSFCTSLLIGSIGQLFNIVQPFFISRGVMVRFLLWVLPITAIVAYFIHPGFGFDHLSTAFVAALIPTLIVSFSCIQCMYFLLPRIKDLFSDNK